MKLNFTQKIQAACSALEYRDEIKQLLIRRFWQRKKVLEVAVAGVPVRFDTSDFLSNTFFWRNEFATGYEPAVCEVLARLIRKSKVYADVGGNVGFFSVLPAKLNPNCKIYYVEMDSTIRPLLLRNMKLNGLDEARITVVNAAVGDHEGQLEYAPHPYSFLAMACKENTDIYDLKYRAPLITLDAYFAKEGVDPDLLKIDIDGAEMGALRGMARILEQTRPDMLLEVHPAYLPQFGSSTTEVNAFLRRFGYRYFVIPDFRNTSVPRLNEIPDFENLASKTGDMIFVTARKEYSGGVLDPV